MIIEIDYDDNEKLEALSLERNQSKGFIALLLCENFFGSGVPHRTQKFPHKQSSIFLPQGGAHLKT